LVIDAEAQAKVDQVLVHALANPYYLASGKAPGGDPRHCVELNTFHCVFSLSIDDAGGRWRHLSISVPSEKYPNPVAVSEIAGLFGFSRHEDGVEARVIAGAWLTRVDLLDHCIIVAEKYS